MPNYQAADVLNMEIMGEATYLSLYTDTDRNALQGSKQYRLQFSADNLPPARAFWSVSMYNRSDYTLVDNVIDRYSIGDRTEGIRYADDGSLTIHISQSTPEADQRSNWLPAPAEDFYLILRVYLPEQSVIDQEWQPPGLELVQ